VADPALSPAYAVGRASIPEPIVLVEVVNATQEPDGSAPLLPPCSTQLAKRPRRRCLDIRDPARKRLHGGG
jgi:hypothetical protein